MTVPRYILAKYVPDLGRMEPLNIGIILWHKGRLRSEFLPYEEARFVGDRETYLRWVDHWRCLISRDEITLPGHRPVPTDVEECIDVLVKAQEGEYMLVDAGFVPQDVPVGEIQKVVEFLYQELVVRPASPAHAKSQAKILKERAEALLKQTGAADRDDYQGSGRVACNIHGVEMPLRVNHYWGNGQPRAIMQRVALGNDVGFQSSAFVIEAITSLLLPRKHCAALIQGSDIASPRAERYVQLLEELCLVVDVESETAAEKVVEVAFNGRLRQQQNMR